MQMWVLVGMGCLEEAVNWNVPLKYLLRASLDLISIRILTIEALKLPPAKIKPVLESNGNLKAHPIFTHEHMLKKGLNSRYKTQSIDSLQSILLSNYLAYR